MASTHDDVKKAAREARANARNIAFQFTMKLDQDRPDVVMGRLFWLICDVFEQLIWTHKLDDLQGRLITPETINWLRSRVRSNVEDLCRRNGIEMYSQTIFDWLCHCITINGEPLPLPEKK